MAFTPLPTPPSITRPTPFATEADAFIAALVAFQLEMEGVRTLAQAAMDAGLAGAAAAASQAAGKALEAFDSAQAAALARNAAGDHAAAALLYRNATAALAAGVEAIVGFPVPTIADVGKFLGVAAGQEMKWLPAGVRMVTEYVAAGVTSWTAPAKLVGGSVTVEETGAGAGGAILGGYPGGLGGASACHRHFTVTGVVPGQSYPCARGAPGAANPGGTIAASNPGGSTSIFGLVAGGGQASAGGVSSGSVSAGLTLTMDQVTDGTAGAAGGSNGTSFMSVGGNTPVGNGAYRYTTVQMSLPSGYGAGGSGSSQSTPAVGGIAGGLSLLRLTYFVSP